MSALDDLVVRNGWPPAGEVRGRVDGQAVGRAYAVPVGDPVEPPPSPGGDDEAFAAAEFELGAGVIQRATASFGVAATGGQDDVDGLGLIARADRALYAAKEAGRDRVVADQFGD